MNSPLLPFHIAFPVCDIESTRAFYGELLGCPEGRSAPGWVDFNLFGHQIVAHLAPEEAGASRTNTVDGHGVPARHFGASLTML
jgi:extradiol dioxygenase family protein